MFIPPLLLLLLLLPWLFIQTLYVLQPPPLPLSLSLALSLSGSLPLWLSPSLSLDRDFNLGKCASVLESGSVLILQVVPVFCRQNKDTLCNVIKGILTARSARARVCVCPIAYNQCAS